MNQQTETRQTLAQAISNQFTSGTRPGGTSYTTAPDDSQARELVQHVHFSVFDGMLPNDWIYQKTREIVDLFAENDDELESAYELADIYTSDLIDWARYGTFRAFIDKAAEEVARWMNPSDITLDGIIIAGQQEVLNLMAHTIGQWLDEQTQ